LIQKSHTRPSRQTMDAFSVLMGATGKAKASDTKESSKKRKRRSPSPTSSPKRQKPSSPIAGSFQEPISLLDDDTAPPIDVDSEIVSLASSPTGRQIPPPKTPTLEPSQLYSTANYDKSITNALVWKGTFNIMHF